MFFKPYIIWSAAQDSSSIAWRNYIAPAQTSVSAYYFAALHEDILCI